MDYILDAANKSLGRLASEIALLLQGKDSSKFVPYLFSKNKVIIANPEKIKITGKKLKEKIYYRYTGYPGGLRKKTMEDLFKKDPKIVIKKAVFGMLPKNKLRKQMIKNLEFK